LKVPVYKHCAVNLIFLYEPPRCAIYQWYILTPS